MIGKIPFNKYRSLIFYGIFGVMTTVINTVAYMLCFGHLGIGNVPSTVIAWAIAVAFAFFTNKIWVFESKSFSASVFFAELWKFISCRLATGVLDLAIMYIGVDVLSGPAAYIKLGSNILVILLNYILSKVLIFRSEVNMKSQINKTSKDRSRERLFRVLTAAALFSITFFAAMRSSWTIFAKSGRIGTDSSVFRYIAWEMTMGKVPYRDLFDHKGPLLFFINYIGTCIGPIRGIWIVEFVFLFALTILIYKMARRMTGRPYSLFIVLLSLALLSKYYEGGNLTEEYAMTFQIAATCIFLDFFTSPKKYTEAPAKDSFLHWGTRWFNMGVFLCGLCFAGVFFLRANMISVWMVFCPAVLIYCVWKKEYPALWKFILSFLLGAAVLILPVLIYLVANHAFGDFIYTYFVFNMQYSHCSVREKAKVFEYFFNTFPLLLSLFIMSVKIERAWKQRRFSAIQLFDCAYVIYILLTVMLVAMSGRGFNHYGMVLCPAFSYPFCIMCSMLGQEETRRAKVDIVVIAYLTITFLVPNWLPAVYGAAERIYDGLPITTYVDWPKDEIVSYILEHTEPDDEITVFGNCNTYYLYSGRRSASKYSYQFPVGTVSPAILDEYFEDLLDHQPKMIVEVKHGDIRMETFLKENDYMCVIEGDIMLYQKK